MSIIFIIYKLLYVYAYLYMHFDVDIAHSFVERDFCVLQMFY